MIGQSPAFRDFLALLAKVASYDAPVLIEGETGTGKELAAREIHYSGCRSDQPFVPVNCGALPDSLIENELFGHCRGAYTDAASEQFGLVELARGGTLFLDEVDALSPKGQVTLLRFLQDQQYRPLGARTQRSADVRVIAASNRGLETLARTGDFRFDLMYRLRILCLHIPPLRARHGDVRLLAEHFVRSASARFNKPLRPFAPSALAWLESCAWPGNVRELENVVYQAFLLTDGPEILIAGANELEPSRADERDPLDYRSAKSRAITEFERRFLSQVMARAGGNVTAAARMIGTERRHLGRLLKKFNIERTHSPSP
jgi:DNA-binding NtrC family response regulator